MTAAIGIFDSGVGGLSVWREIARLLPQESTLYVADQAHIPYGPRPAEEVRAYAEGITQFLLDRGSKLIVVACNAASAAALKQLRERHPDVLFVGMEPAVKPAAQQTRSKVVGVMATPATLRGRMFELAVQRFTSDVTLINQPCPGLVERIEAGDLDSEETQKMLAGFLAPMLGAGADTLVLACTHYPFVLDTIRRIAGPQLTIIDPAPAVARQVQRVLAERGLLAPDSARATRTFHTSGDPSAFCATAQRLLGIPVTAHALRWHEAGLVGPATSLQPADS